ncbi:hypothetical protein [Sorangium sp. So ce131]|uniref:hypothetical protein n=1 Tax=Sorangium sp. So ce131 TaxID=3133282 RepID=UPI003F630E26
MQMRLLAGSILVAFFLLSHGAHAGPDDNRALSDALFNEGRALVKQGRYAEACPKLEVSQRLDPAAGTLLVLGDCYEGNGQTASAWVTFHEAAAMARKAGDERRANEAVRRAYLLDPKLSKIVIEVAAESRTAMLEVRRNGKPIDALLLGTPIPVDPGMHTIEASALGKETWSMTVQVDGKPGLTIVRVPALTTLKWLRRRR